MHLGRSRCGHRFPSVPFAGTIVAANVLTTQYGLVDVGFGMTATGGTGGAGLTLLTRDWQHHTAGRTVAIAAIAVGTVASAVLAGPRLALASGTAFAVRETADLLVHQRLRRGG